MATLEELAAQFGGSPAQGGDLDALAAQFGGTAEPQKTSARGVGGALTRGLALPAAGAVAGAGLGSFFGGVGALPGAAAGAGAATLAGVVGDPIVNLVNKTLGTKYTLPTEAMEDMLTRIGVAEPRTEAEKIVKATAAGAAGAGGMVSAGQTLAQMAASPVTRGVGQMMAANPAVQAASGAGAGAAGQYAQERGAGPLAQLAAALGGGLAGSALAARLPGAMQTAARQVPKTVDIAEAEKAGIRLLTSDVAPPRNFASKTVQSLGEKIPVAGTGGVRQAQQAERIKAVRNVLEEFGADDVNRLTDDVMDKLATKRSADIQKYAQLKGDVFQKLDSAGPVPVPNATAAIDEQITRLESLKTQELAPVIAKLTDWKDAVQGQTIVNVESLRKQLGESFKEPGLASIKSIGEKALNSIYGPLKQDMEAFIKANGDVRDVTKWKVADARLADVAGDLRNTSLRSVLMRGEETPEVIGNILFRGKPSEVRAIYSRLPPSGRANARAAILAEAAKKSASEVAEGTIVSPDKFANEVKRMGNSVGVFFSGDELQRVNGLVRVLNITKRAGEASAHPVTGVQAVPFVAGSLLTDLFGSAGAATASAAGVGLMARAYESAPVRNLLLQMSKTDINSPQAQEIARRTIAAIQAQTDKEENK